MADAITDAMIEAGVKALRERVTLRFPHMDAPTVEEIYLAMEAARQPPSQVPADHPDDAQDFFARCRREAEAKRAGVPADDGLIKALRETIVELWHDANSGHGTLHECLGMTWEEYQLWVMDPEALSRHKAPLSVAGDDVRLAERIAAIIAFNRNKSNFEIARTIRTALQVTEGDKVERLIEARKVVAKEYRRLGLNPNPVLRGDFDAGVEVQAALRSQSNKVSKPL